MKKNIYFFFAALMLVSFSCQKPAQEEKNETAVNKGEHNWWPVQPVPNGILISKQGPTHGENALTFSLAGLVAQAQKQGIVDELIWIESKSKNKNEYPKWYQDFVQRTKAEERGTFNVWELLKRYKNKDIIKGYILYTPEMRHKSTENLNISYNVAASYAGVKQAIIIDEALEPAIKELGYKLLLDARTISREECFDDLKDLSNKNLVVTMGPGFHNNIDFAIANKAMVTFGTDALTEKIMKWANPLSPVVGWNTGGEDEFTKLPSKYGLFNTASDWCYNLIALSAGAENATYEKIKTIDPKTIDYERKGNFHSFVMSDGDNMQWTIGNFLNNPNYWGNPSHGEYPMGFTSCQLNLSMMAPDVMDEMGKTQPQQTTVIEYGGGYQYPDLFAMERGEEQEAIQKAFAQKVNLNMKRTGSKVFGFICMDVNSEAAINAYRIYAEEIEDLTGMFAVQYEPYHGGYGEVIWVKNKKGIEIPVVTAKYSLWKGLDYMGGGNVEEVSMAINNHVEGKDESMDWTIVHAWSTFENPANPGEMRKGLDPTKWCIEQLDEKIKVVSPEELLWRIRMKHNKAQTSELIL